MVADLGAWEGSLGVVIGAGKVAGEDDQSHREAGEGAWVEGGGSGM
jgi:hypothetical protein